MNTIRKRVGLWGAFALAVVLTPAHPIHALERLTLTAPDADGDLLDRLRAASLLLAAEREKTTDSQTLFAAARADYARLIAALYAEGHYSGVIQIRIDGQEAADIAPLDAPERIDTIEISVMPGPLFRFSKARMRPYAPGTKLPPAYGDTKPAYSTAIVAAADAGVSGWRAIGHAKARVTGQSIMADHASATIASEIVLEPGPAVRFGQMRVSGQERMRLERIQKIAGFPAGEVFDPAKLDKVANRLRRTGVFSTVALTEAETLGPGDTLDADLVLDEEKLRRFGVGAEVSTTEGLGVSGYWLHRNLLGGAERLRVDGSIDQIGGTIGVADYQLGVRLDRPATPVTDATAFVEARASRIEILDLSVDKLEFGFGLTRQFSDHLSAEAGLSYVTETASVASFEFDYRVFALPMSLTWDTRDTPLDAHKGYLLQAGLTPFYGSGLAESGSQIKAEARAYRPFGADDRFVLAGRAQLGTLTGTSLIGAPPDYLFWSGGGGSVRGQPYQSLGVTVTPLPGLSYQTGGLSFAGISGEVRARITDRIGAVGFYDTGFVSDGELFGGTGEWHAGAGLGLRYNTGIGPIRLDVAMPVSGSTGDGVQLYVGIGQAF